MKKLVFMFVAVAAISFASCGNQQAQQAPVDEDTIEVAEVADSAANDSVETADSAAVEAAPAE